MKSEFIELIAKKVALEDYFGDKVENEDVESDYLRVVGLPEDNDHSVFKSYNVSKIVLSRIADDFINDQVSNPITKRTSSIQYLRGRACELAFMRSNPDVISLEDARNGYLKHVTTFDANDGISDDCVALPNSTVDPMKQQFAAEVKWLSSVLKVLNEGVKSFSNKGVDLFELDRATLFDAVAREGNESLESSTPQKHHVVFVVSETYEIVDEESASNGEAKETGHNWDSVDYTPDELSDYLSNGGYFEGSCSSGISSLHDSVSSSPDLDFKTGETKTCTLHCNEVRLIDGSILDEQKAGRLWAYICNKHLDAIKAKSKDRETESPFMENIGYH